MGGQDTHPRCAMHTVNRPYSGLSGLNTSFGVTSGWAVTRPEQSMSDSANNAPVENSRGDRRTEPIVRTVPFIMSAEDQGILGLSRKLEK